MAKVKIGIIGAGMVGQEHIMNLQKMKGVKVTWVADLNESLLKRVIKKHKIQNDTTDYSRILEDPGISAVFICTPPNTHFEIFTNCITAEKHILLEKPAVIKKEDLNSMLALAGQYPELIICEASCRHTRLQPKFRFVKEMIDSGKLGEIYYIHQNSVVRQFRPGIEYNPPAKWFLNKEISGGGPVMDWGIYDLSFHLGILSDKPELKSVKAFTKNQLDRKDSGASINDVEEHAVALMEFSGGLKYYWERAAHANVDVPGETRIYGTKGGLKFSYLTWDSNAVEYFYITKKGKGKAKSRIFEVDMLKHPGDHYALDKHFINVILKKKKPAMPLHLTAKHLRILFEIYEAANKS